MGRIIALVIGLAVLSFVAEKALTARASDGKSLAPKDRLDNVRGAAKRIEANDQAHVNDVLNKAGAAEGMPATTTD